LNADIFQSQIVQDVGRSMLKPEKFLPASKKPRVISSAKQHGLVPAATVMTKARGK